MDRFEFFMVFYGLLLGLAVAELLRGFANIARARTRPKLGWLTPVLAVVVFFAIITSFVDAWAKMADVRLRLESFILPSIIGGAYFFAAVVVVPKHLDEWNNLDDYFFARRKWTVGLLLAPFLATLALELPLVIANVQANGPARLPGYIAVNSLWLGSLLVALLARNKWVVSADWSRRSAPSIGPMARSRSKRCSRQTRRLPESLARRSGHAVLSC